MKLTILPAVTDRQHATILAALRFWQDRGLCRHLRFDDPFEPIATNCGELDPLDTDEIDDLCKSLNFPEQSPATPAEPPQPTP